MSNTSKPLKTVEKEIVNYRIWCDYAVQEKEQGLIDQKEYERAIEWHLAEAVKQLNNHYYQLMLSLVDDCPDTDLEDDISNWKYYDDYRVNAGDFERGYNKAVAELRQKLSEHFNVENHKEED